MIGNKSADKITSVSKQSTKKLYNNDETEEDVERVTHKKRYISPEERRQIIDELRLIPRKGAYFQKLLIDWLINVNVTKYAISRRKTTHCLWIKVSIII